MNICDAYNNQPCSRKYYEDKVPCCRECAEFPTCQHMKCFNDPKICGKCYTPEQVAKLKEMRKVKHSLLRKIERSKNHDETDH